ncbi:hypothetical protein K0T92_19145 [Paenibacillus oenotherae]|uniref:Prolipoprotein diacylglyceryl transferase n=1 Tax=Paenibacillus oenotherae TaxID=1435645 RepID=A0ABS7DAC6_9BACL|nr:hypothetical protein [Paenibacillus oenotherae]MBW7476836.1 hypothetical protein [Paenibacillus oenotherae]
MPELISIGTFRLDGGLLAAFLSVIAGLTALGLWTKRSPDTRNGPWLDLLTNAAVITVIGWKIGFLLHDPALLWERPSSLIIVRGSLSDLLLGLLAAALYMTWTVKRKRISWLRLLDVIPYAALPGFIVWNAITAFPYRIVYMILVIFIYAALLRSQEAGTPGTGDAIRLVLLGAGFGGLVSSLFAAYPQGTWPQMTLGLTLLQWCLIGLAVIGSLWRKPSG